MLFLFHRSALIRALILFSIFGIFSPHLTAQERGPSDFSKRAEELRKDAIKTLVPEDKDAKAPAGKPVIAAYQWKAGIVTSVFSIADKSSQNGASVWDPLWQKHYGGFDDPDPKHRKEFIPSAFVPQLNPFYVALPYNDIAKGHTKAHAREVIPWFSSVFSKDGVSVCQNRWVAIRKGRNKVAYAQWNDCGPFDSDAWQYVFGTARQPANEQQGTGLWVSPAVRDYLGLLSRDVTDWRFVEVSEVPPGPWAQYGLNNPLAKGSNP